MNRSPREYFILTFVFAILFAADCIAAPPPPKAPQTRMVSICSLSILADGKDAVADAHEANVKSFWQNFDRDISGIIESNLSSTAFMNPYQHLLKTNDSHVAVLRKVEV
ncbi:MAG: hypothetical protein V4692_04500, partial [Bdellovibrionota bacterium]